MGRRLVAVLVVAGAGLSGPALGQEDLTRGKTPAQLFASDCADCHRNPRSISRRDNPNTLAAFLRVHYTASRESAAAIAAYLVALGGPVEPARPARPASRSKPAASQDQSKPSTAATPAAKPSEAAPPKPSEPAPEPPAAAAPAAPASEPAPAAPENPQ